MFIENKYKKWYDSLMEMGVKEKPNYYTERHHIIPKSLGGDDCPENLVYLTARQHYVAHLLLLKFTEGVAKRSMALALIRFCGANRKKGRYFISSRIYETIRKEYSDAVKGKNNPMYGKPCYYNMSEEELSSWKSNISQGTTGEKNPFYGKSHSDETKEAISKQRSQPILVKFCDGREEEFSQYKFLGTYLGRSTHLGGKLMKPQFKHLWKNYNIESIKKL